LSVFSIYDMGHFRMWLEEQDGLLVSMVRKIIVPGYYYLAHGCGQEAAQRNMQQGIWVGSHMPWEHFITIDDPEAFAQQLPNWPHRGYKFIFVVALPNGTHYTDVLTEAPQDRKYIVPVSYIRGYFDMIQGRFVDNQVFAPQPIERGQGEVSKMLNQNNWKRPKQAVVSPSEQIPVPAIAPNATANSDIW
jgi:hypothetical protein